MVNIVVLTHKDMRSNPINLILTGIAVADCLLMVEYIPFTLHMYLRDDQTREADEKVVVTTLGSIQVLRQHVWGGGLSPNTDTADALDNCIQNFCS